MKVSNDIKKPTIVKLLVMVIFFVFNTIVVFNIDSVTNDPIIVTTDDVEIDLD